MKTPVIGRIALFVLLLRSAPAAAADDPLRLTIGDPSRRDKTAPLVLDGITETATGALLKPSDLPSRLSAVRILFVGEEHVSVESHAVELAVLRELSRAGRRVSVGLEMFPVDAGPALADWTAGRLTEAEFLEKSGWMKHWSYNWDYYRGIFVFARDNRIPLFGVNVPPELVSTVGRKGLDALEPAQRALLPERVDWDNAESKRLFQASFDEDEFHGALPEAMLNRMVQAQATWDAAFGWNAVRAAKASDDPKSIVVVLLGQGHVAYGLGAERQAKLWFSGKTATLVPAAISDTEKGRCAIESVQASLADYVWGIPEEEDPRYPTPGFATRRVENDGQPEVIQVDKKSSAARAGLKVGDRLLEVDGRPTADREAIRNAFADKRWGDGLRLTVRRGDEKMPLDVVLRRERPSPCKPKV
ncbi:MAG TPA: ChaN family lipoprotein [Thermoanaerobaculia bacterium]|nr:ChaN family lipoprotein [Thermoanaerobaculia bacterium]